MKIVFCLDTIGFLGGMESVTVTKVNALSQIEGNEVWVVITEKIKEPQPIVSPRIHMVNLDVGYHEVRRKWPTNIIPLIIRQFRHRRRLAFVLGKIDPDIVVSVGGFEKYITPFIKGRWKLLREIHNVADSRRRVEQKCLRRISATFRDWLDYDFITPRFYDHIIVLTQRAKEKFRADDNRISVIPNPSRFRPESISFSPHNRIIAVGRLENEKCFTSMIKAYSLVSKRFPEWKLDIYGEGSNRPLLMSMIEEYGLSGIVRLRGFTADIEKELLSSSLLAMTSRFESFGMVLVEAMSCGLPVVAYDCPVGPGTIITDGNDGFLVPFGDEKAMADRLGQLMCDQGLREKMGRNAFESSRRYSVDLVIAEWMELFKKVLDG